MSEIPQSDARPPALHCLQGKMPPPPVVLGWKALLGLPRGAIDHFWTLLETTLNEGENADDAIFEAFSQRFGVQPTQLFAAVSACDFLIRQASVVNLSADHFREDLDALSGDNTIGRDLLMGHFGTVRDHLRKRILEDTLADHGRVLTGLEWRIDRLEASHRGIELDLPVLFLALHYRDAEDTHRLSVQLTPEALGSLRELFDRFK